MKYMGSKRRISKYIIETINNTELDWVEPFVGGANMIENVTNRNRYGYDNNKYVISFLNELSKNPENLYEKLNNLYKTYSEETWRYYKNNKDSLDPALVGFVGVVGSFGANWFKSFAKSDEKRSVFLEGLRNAQKQSPKIKDVVFEHKDFTDIQLERKSIIYCDPPYKGVAGYSVKDFDHDKFWIWAEDMSKIGHLVYVSEYNAPDNWESILHIDIKDNLNKHKPNNKIQKEKLFILKK